MCVASFLYRNNFKFFLGKESDLGHQPKNGQITEVVALGIRDAIVWWVGLEKA